MFAGVAPIAPSRTSHHNINNPGTAAAVVNRKKAGQPMISANQPAEADNTVRPTAVSAVSSANWVAV